MHERRVHAGALFTTNRKASVEQYAVIWVNGDKAVHAAEAGKPWESRGLVIRGMSMETRHVASRLPAPFASSNSVQKQCVVRRRGQLESTG